MRLPASEGVRWALVVALGALVLAAINLWWIVENRHGYPLNVDEAGYAAIGLVDYFGLRGGGLSGWWEAVQSQAPVAPLVPAMTSLLLVFSTGVLQGFGVMIGFLVLLAFATYGIGERLAGPRLGALAALAVATSFGVITFAREYTFALPTAALLACAVYALLRSDGLRLRHWAVGCGAALGLMLLARTMSIAFIPGVLAAAALIVAVRRTELATRLVNLGLLALTGLVIAASWYVRNWTPVYDYLTDFGYGAQSAHYGEETSVLSWERWSTVAERMVFADLLVPLAALVFAGLVVLLVAAVRHIREAPDRPRALLTLAGSDAAAVVVIVVAGYLALTSSQNAGNGFTLPIAMLLPPLAVISLRYVRGAGIPVTIAIALIAALNMATTSNLWDGLSRPRLVQVPGFGSLPWMDGTPRSLAAIRVQVPGSDFRFDERDRGWPEADRALASMLIGWEGPDGQLPVTAFASRNRAISSNSVNLAALAEHRRGLPFTQLNAEPSDSVDVYIRQLRDPEFGQPAVLVTMSHNTDDFEPPVTQALAEQAGRRLGFRQVDAMALPDGRQLRVWVRRGSETAKVASPPGSHSDLGVRSSQKASRTMKR